MHKMCQTVRKPAPVLEHTLLWPSSVIFTCLYQTKSEEQKGCQSVLVL